MHIQGGLSSRGEMPSGCCPVWKQLPAPRPDGAGSVPQGISASQWPPRGSCRCLWQVFDPQELPREGHLPAGSSHTQHPLTWSCFPCSASWNCCKDFNSGSLRSFPQSCLILVFTKDQDLANRTIFVTYSLASLALRVGSPLHTVPSHPRSRSSASSWHVPLPEQISSIFQGFFSPSHMKKGANIVKLLF